MTRLAHRFVLVLAAILLLAGVARPAWSRADEPVKESEPVNVAEPGKEAEPAREAEPDGRPLVDSVEARLLKALDTRGNFNFDEVPLSDFVEFLADYLGINVIIDEKSLQDVGLAGDLSVTIHLNKVKARSCLRMLLDQHELTWTIRDEAVVITTPEDAESQLKLRVYPIRDLVRTADGLSASEELMNLIRSTASPISWDAVGGPGSIEELYGTLWISQTNEVHEQILALLDKCRAVRRMREQNPDKAPSPSVLFDDEESGQVRAALDNRFDLDCDESPLTEVVDFLADTCKINVLLDEKSMNDVGIGPDVPITVRAQQLTLRTILNRILRPHGLTWIVRDEVLLITTPEASEAVLPIRFYPIYDLPPSDPYAGQPYDRLTTAIRSTVEPHSWHDVGGPGTLQVLLDPPTLVVSQTEHVHQQVHDLLREVRQTREKMGVEAKAAAADKPRLKVYYLLPPQEHMPRYTAEDLVRIVPKLIEPDSWTGKEVVVEHVPGALLIRQTPRIHAQVQKLLTELGVWMPTPPAGGWNGGFGGGGAGGLGNGGGFGGGGGGGFFSVP